MKYKTLAEEYVRKKRLYLQEDIERFSDAGFSYLERPGIKLNDWLAVLGDRVDTSVLSLNDEIISTFSKDVGKTVVFSLKNGQPLIDKDYQAFCGIVGCV